MKLVLMLVLVSAMVVLFFSGYYMGVLREKFGKSVFMFIPITIALFMFNLIWSLTELAKTARWQ